MSCRRVYRPLQVAVAHGSLLLFTVFVSLKLHRAVNWSWWFIFAPLWLFHSVVARGRFSIPATSTPHGRNWAPLHAIIATPLLVAFELLLCEHLQKSHAVNLKIVFLPLLGLEILVLFDNVRMCGALLPRDEGSINGAAVRIILPHFWIAFSMVFFISATTFTLLKLCGDVTVLGWWDLFINYCVAECFAFLVCTKWNTPANLRHAPRNAASSSTNSGLGDIVSIATEEDNDAHQTVTYSLQDICSYLMAIPSLVFQVILFMYLEGTPPVARYIPMPVIFSPLFLLQGCWFLYYTCILINQIVWVIHDEPRVGETLRASPTLYDSVGFLGWWSIDEGSQEELANLLYSKGVTGYNTFSPEEVKKMAKDDLINEIQKLQSALAVQRRSTKVSRDEFEKLQTEKIICQVCFDKQISVVLLPCRHHILCSECSAKCQKCPVCRVFIVERLPVNEV